jgi:gliding motility-associated-like protein
MKYSIYTILFIAFNLVVSNVFSQECNILDTSTCFVYNKYQLGPIQLELKSASTVNGLRFRSHLTFADITDDCYPEVMLIGVGFKIFAVNPISGDTLFTIPILGDSYFSSVVSISNVDNSTQLFYAIDRVLNKSDRGRIVCMNVDGTTRWVSDDFHVDKNREHCTGTIGFADFNQDGIPEVYVGNRIFNARTGVKLADGGEYGIGQDHSFGVSVAAQLDDDPSDLELAAGYTIYKVNIANPDGPEGNTMTPYNIQVDEEYRDGLTAIGDINGDGILDVIVHSETAQYDPRLYAYTLVGGVPTLLAKAVPPQNVWLKQSNMYRTSTPVIGRISNSEFPSILIIRESQMLSYHYEGSLNLALQWTHPHSDISAMTSIALFDLNGDGISEIIHRDETHLRIIDGNSFTPIELASTPCTSGTLYEGPIVGDILNNGSSQICITCQVGPIGNNQTQVKVFGSPDSLPPWAPGRKVWNQYAYHINNVNDDLTIPAVQKNNATDLNGRYNSFMEQQSLLDTNGYYRIRAASLYGELGCINYEPISQLYTISFDLHNRADASLPAPAGMPVAFYDGDPLSGGALLGVYHSSQPIAAGESLLDLMFSFTSPPLTQLHMVVNTDNSSLSTIDEDEFSIPECDYTDNFSLTTDLSINLPDTLMLGTCDPAQLGTFTDTLSSVQGCDSIVVRVITMLPSDETHVALPTCDPSQVGTDTLWLQNAQGCDSLVMTTLTLSPSYFIQETIDTCNQALAGTDTLYFQSIDGCDSIVVLTTIYSGHYQEHNTQIICGSGTNYTDTVIVSGGPCDSLFITDYQYVALDSTWLTSTTCDPTEAVYEVITLVNQQGCDSVVTRSIVWVGTDTTFLARTSCDSAQVGVFVQVLPMAGVSCDSVVVETVSWSAQAVTVLPAMIRCEAAGPAADTTLLVAASGCDSLVVRPYSYTQLAGIPEALDEGCAGAADGQLALTVTSGSAPPWEYRLNAGLWQTAPVFSGLAPGSYTMTVRDANGCTRVWEGLLIQPGETLTLDAGPDRQVEPGAIIDLSVQSSALLAQVQWQAADPLSCATCATTTLGPISVSQTVTVQGWTAAGCTDTDQVQIHVTDRDLASVYIPNSFSPNGDGINDLFTVYGNEAVRAIRQFAVYDRWGNALYLQRNLPVNDPSAGWDGTFRGRLMDPGVYVYTIELELVDGSTRLYKGDVQLTR